MLQEGPTIVDKTPAKVVSENIPDVPVANTGAATEGHKAATKKPDVELVIKQDFA